VKIAGREIADGILPYVIAEVSCNHMGGLSNALDLVKAARWAGADAVKFQAYTPDTLTLNCNKTDFIIQDGIWKGNTLYDLYQKTHTPFEWFPKLFKAAEKEGITAFASVFDPSSVAMLERLGCPAYKIASMEITDVPLIACAAATHKPLIISTGMATNKEILDARAAAPNCAFLHCTSEYPGTTEWADLTRMEKLRALLNPRGTSDTPIGLSDHTKKLVAPLVATSLRAAIIEKHIMASESVESEDKEFSLDAEDFKAMVALIKMTHESLQPRVFASNPSNQFRRSLYAVMDIAEGDEFTEANIRSIRPGYGIAPKNITKLLGKPALQHYRRGDRIT
jgi:pseudaminic acid synthase